VSDPVEKSTQEWKALLSDEEYRILREKGTERAFTGVYNDEKRPGTYRCRGCGTDLFSSETKYDSDSGWPSFSDVVDRANVRTETDRKFAMTRTEILCASCGGHLGHVFPDGPGPTGLRYCVNSASLKLVPEQADPTDPSRVEGSKDP